MLLAGRWLPLSEVDHPFGADVAVEILAAQKSKLHSRLFQREILLISPLGDLRGAVVADDRIQCSDEHQGIGQMAGDGVTIRRDTDHAVFGETGTGICQPSERFQQVMNQDRFKGVEFKMAVGPGDTNSDIVAHHLRCDQIVDGYLTERAAC